jgi:hypothetical protein
MRAFGLILLALSGCGPTSLTTDAGSEVSCRETGKTPENLLMNPGFECGATPTEWAASYGTASFPAEGRSGRAAKVVADAAGGRLGYVLDVVTASRPATYCARAWVKGTAPYMRLSLVAPSPTETSNDQLTSSWKQVPYARAKLQSGEKLQLLLEVQTARGDGLNAKPDDVLYVDDVDVWESASGRCNER